MEIISDLHLHSRFSRAVSSKINLHNLYRYGKRKGINLLSLPDFTHPVWFKEVQYNLQEVGSGVYKIVDKNKIDNDEFSTDLYSSVLGPYFIFVTELATFYVDKGKGRRIHSLVFSPNIETVEKINGMLHSQGFNLGADGRPMLKISTKNLYELLLSIDKNIMIIPCHVWTPHFGLYGSKTGYDSIEECFEELNKYIYAVETGLSSDPNMNWRVEELKSRSIVSFSDSHSLEKMGREATVFKIKDQKLNPLATPRASIKNTEIQINFEDIIDAIKQKPRGKLEIGYTIEFYPEEGKYHFTGHRKCRVSFSPEDVKKKGVICPVCGKRLTVGVMNRVDDLSKEGSDNSVFNTDKLGVTWVHDKNNIRPPYISLVPFMEIISSALSSGITSTRVVSMCEKLTSELGPEFKILLKTDIGDIEKVAGSEVADAVKRVRERDLTIVPGFDGEFGTVEIFSDSIKSNVIKKEQLGLDF